MPDIASILKLPLSPQTPTPDAGALSRPAETPLSAEPPLPKEPAPHSPSELQVQLDRILEDANTSLRFRVDDESQRVVVAVIDGKGEVIMQIPDEAALAVARQLAKSGTLLDLKV
ncbi:MAG: hypothetical protein AVDCRST_MAG71-1916 [uncultured Lysobacter sp.]|uniref:Flagellar protein FlaG n=1 Tax=uncultured Lysobacter sp. TaxID=271060 RepID=A0A6J4LPL9_9GAMM|nr:MAG: hypothetical protein AVDCRST_MAG71-1916 [uncultured Lysobacter sp.]